MKKLIFLLGPIVFAQPISTVLVFPTNPSGTTCATRRVATNTADGHFLYCNPSTLLWVDTSAGVASGAPQWLHFLGDGSGGAMNCTTTQNTGEYWVSSFTVSNGNTCTFSLLGRQGSVIRSTGACTIAGTINARGADGGIIGTGDVGGSGGGGGGGTAAGAIGSLTAPSGIGSVSNIWGAGGTAGASSGGVGGNGQTPIASSQKEALSMSILLRGGGQGGAGGTGSAAGGAGGENLILVCGSINFTGTINVNGANGTNSAANNNGGGGGGGGGVVILSTPTYTANTGTINVSGGTGGTCGAFTGCGIGGNGGPGWSMVLTMQ